MNLTAKQLGVAMALVIAGCLMLVTGCRSTGPDRAALPPTPAATADQGVTRTMFVPLAVATTAPPMVIIQWIPNYVQTNEATGIESSLDLANWGLRFMGHTNTCTLLATNQQEFYRAFNIETNI